MLEVEGLTKHFPVGGMLGRRGILRAVEDVSFGIARGEVLSLVGESGSGKTTIGRMVLRLTAPTRGQILFRGQEISHLSRRALRPMRRHMQPVFQDPFSALNPRKTIEAILAAPLLVHGICRSRAERRSGSSARCAASACSPALPIAIRTNFPAASASASASPAR